MTGAASRTPDWECAWEVSFPLSSDADLLVALLVRDELHGRSFDVELAEGGGAIAVDYLTGDEYEDGMYRLLVTAQVSGDERRTEVQSLTEDLLEQLVDEAERLAGEAQLVATVDLGELRFEVVPDDRERWDLVIPDWLAPDGAEVPYGFRPHLSASGAPWPTDELLDAHGLLVVVPEGDRVRLFAVPAPDESGARAGELPVVS